MISWQNHTLDLLSDEAVAGFDVIVVGAGLGGGLTGLGLARRGLRVLFVEAGHPVQPSPRPSLTKRVLGKLGLASRAQFLAAQGRWSRLEGLRTGGRTRQFYPVLGTGPGGSSAIYGAALERMRRADFAEKPVRESGALPNAWPLDYDAFVPYYAAAEILMSVCGTADPLDPDDRGALPAPPPLSEQDSHFVQEMEAAGLHPYRLHVGVEYRPGCVECIGRICLRGCKAEGMSRGLVPALRDHGARIAFGAEAEALIAEGSRITGVRLRIGGQPREIRAATVVLAAGALNTPGLLLRSRSETWPTGIGNAHDMVGRGLMFHVSDFLTLTPRRAADAVGFRKTIALRDFYAVDGRKCGGLQSVGVPVSVGQIANFAQDWLDRRLGFRLPGSRLVMQAVGLVAMRMFRRAALFATVMEDFPYAGNRVLADPARPGGFIIDYRKSDELVARTGLLRTTLRQRLSALRPVFVSGDDNLNYGHACGTCRFGDDPQTSVLSPDCRVRGTENLYVTDASFMASSSGANPSLTVAANAIRVSEIIAGRMLSA